jgi:hypothetical protein
METDCFVDAFQFLGQTFPFDQIVHPESESVIEYATKMADSWASAQQSLATTFKDACRGKMWESSIQIMDKREKGDGGGGQKATKKVEYPTVILLCGSAGSPLKVIIARNTA